MTNEGGLINGSSQETTANALFYPDPNPAFEILSETLLSIV